MCNIVHAALFADGVAPLGAIIYDIGGLFY